MMPDREKVIKGLPCLTGVPIYCETCPYSDEFGFGYGNRRCAKECASDALELLKEQEHKDRMFHALEDDWKRLKELLKEQEERLRKLQKDKDKLCLEVSEWKHKYHDRPLKEQEAVKPVRDKETGRIWLCGKCGTYVGFEDNDPNDPNEFDKYCRECGRSVLWEGL